MTAPDQIAPVGVALPCAVCRRTPERIVALCPECNEAIKARLAHVERLERIAAAAEEIVRHSEEKEADGWPDWDRRYDALRAAVEGKP